MNYRSENRAFCVLIEHTSMKDSTLCVSNLMTSEMGDIEKIWVEKVHGTFVDPEPEHLL